MKHKLTVLIVTLVASMISFAQGKITYVLNGGITNDYGWQCPQDMYNTLNADYNAHIGTTSTWTPLSKLTPDAPELGIPTEAKDMDLTFLESEGFKTHFSWLITYLDATCTEQGKTLPSSSASYLRYNLAAFFQNGVRSSWPVSANYTTCGVSTYEAYQDYWKGGFVGPSEYAASETVILPAPYPANPTKDRFYGWYKDANFTEAINEVSGTGDITVYAKFDEDIPTCAEVAALADNTETKVKGTVSRVCGAEFWIQDATGGLMCFQDNHGLVAGEEVILKGSKITYGGIPELKNITVKQHKVSEPVVPQLVTLDKVLFDATFLTSKLVRIEGVLIKYVTNGDYATPILYYGNSNIEVPCYNITLNQELIPEGSLVAATLIVSEYNGQKQFRGLPEDITIFSYALKDPYAYPEVKDEYSEYTYQLTNNWLYSANLDNWWMGRPNPLAGGTRSILYQDGILYFPYCEGTMPSNPPYLARVKAHNGQMIDPIYFADSIFKKDGEYIFGPFCDVKMDNAGNVVTSNLMPGGTNFQIWTLDLETGGGKLLIDHTDSASYLKNIFPKIGTSIRIDRIGVYGDITNDAIIMAAISGASDVLYWNITKGKWDGKVQHIKLLMADKLGSVPQICPINEDYFYVDGFRLHPILFDYDGNVIDNMGNYPTLLTGINGVERIGNNNGVREFEVNGEYYLLCAGTTFGDTIVQSTFALYKFKDEKRKFNEMTWLYEFPHDGMGSWSNPQRVAVSDVRVAADGKSVEIYVFTAENGYGSYTLDVDYSTDIDDVEYNNQINIRKVLHNGTIYILRNREKYTIDGRRVE